MTPDTHIGDEIYVSYSGGFLRIEAIHEDGSDIIYLNEKNYVALQEFIGKMKEESNGTA